MASGETPGHQDKNPFWKPAISIAVLALALWGADRTQNFPVFSLLGLLGLVCAILAAAMSVLRHDDVKAMQASMAKAGTRMRDKAQKVAEWFGRQRTPVTVVATVTGLLVVAAAGFLAWPWMPAEADAGCPHPGELRLLTTPGSLAAYQELAFSYERDTAKQNTADPHCPTEHLYVYAAPPDSVHAALIAGWAPDGKLFPELMLGPRPDAWLPESTADVRKFQFDADQSAKPDPVGGARSMGTSALVLASTARVADRAVTWSEAVQAVITSGAGLLAPDPKASVAAGFAASAFLRAPVGLVELGEARRRERLVSGSGTVVGDDYPAAVCRFALAEGPANQAVITSRQMWQRYVNSKRLSGSCTAGANASRGGQVITPTDSPVLDHPIVDFTWTSDSRRAALKTFTDWLTAGSGEAARSAIGLDGPRADCVVLYKRAEQDQDPKAPKKSPLSVPEDTCTPPGLQEALDLYDKAQLPGAVLLAVDASGSMKAVVGQGGPTRLALAVQAVDEALDQIGQRDSVGVWTFAGPGYKETAPLAPGSRDQLARVRQGLKDVAADGNTPLYTTILAGLARVAGYGAGTDPEPSRAVVVLTDGQDSGRTPLAAVAEQVRLLTQPKPGQQPAQAAAAPKLFIVATGSASCTGPKGLDVLTVAGRGKCYETELGGVGRTMDKLFEDLWKGE